MKKTINIVQTSEQTRDQLVPYAHSLYVKSWKAKETAMGGHEFNTELSDNIFDAIPVSFQDFKKYFEPRNCVMLTVEITAKII